MQAPHFDRTTARRAVLSSCARTLGAFMGTAAGTLAYHLIGQTKVAWPMVLFMLLCAIILTAVEYMRYSTH